MGSAKSGYSFTFFIPAEFRDMVLGDEQPVEANCYISAVYSMPSKLLRRN